MPLADDERAALRGALCEHAPFLCAVELDDRECPDPVHPLFDDPADHLIFDIRGLVTHWTPKRKSSIEVFDLWREDLRTTIRGAGARNKAVRARVPGRSHERTLVDRRRGRCVGTG